MNINGRISKKLFACQVILCVTLIGKADNAMADSSVILDDLSETSARQHSGHFHLGSALEVVFEVPTIIYVGNDTIEDHPVAATVLPDGVHISTYNGYRRMGNNPTVVDVTGAVSPVPYSARISSPYGYRFGRTTRQRIFHAGVDYYAPLGTPVYAARDGIVEVIARESERSRSFYGYGNAIVINHRGEELWSFYAHLDEVNVEHGATVSAGDVIGRLGSTSNGRFRGMAHHLHFEIRRSIRDGGSPFPGPYRVNNINPLKWLASYFVYYNRDGYEMCGSVQCYNQESMYRFASTEHEQDHRYDHHIATPALTEHASSPTT